MIGRALCLVFAINLVGCSLFIPAPSGPKKDTNMTIGFQDKAWKATDPKESDHAWVEEERGDVMVVNSFCGEFQDLPLETLALKTFSGYNDFKPLGKQTLDWHEREAFEMEAEATVDGVLVMLHLRNYRRNHCYYDFLLVSPRHQAETSLPAFEHMLASVVFR